MGRSRHFDDVRITFAFPLIATAERTSQHVCLVPEARKAACPDQFHFDSKVDVRRRSWLAYHQRTGDGYYHAYLVSHIKAAFIAFSACAWVL